MRADGSLHLDVIDRMVERFAADKVDGLFVCGTTGESVSLSTDERMQVAERWCRAAAGARLPVGVNITHTSLADCRVLAKHAESIGAAGFAVMAPYYFKPAGIPELVTFCAAVAEAAPSLPFYYYNYPRLTGVSLNVADIFAAALDRIPNLCGFKYSGENLIDVGNAMELSTPTRPVQAVYGFEAMMLPALALGVRDFIGGSFNFTSHVFRRVRDAFDAGDFTAARAHQSRGRAGVSAMRRFDFPAASKAILKRLGIDCGPVRPPLRNLSDDEADKLFATLQDRGIFERNA
jgi:N-acetylneuraminate lyase